jgi:PIN domain nuclease of toxin-antitoxin system
VSSVVLDASAVIAIMHGEKGHEIARRYLVGAMISAINYSEVLKKAVERGSSLNAAQYHLENFSLTVVPFDEHLAVRTAELWPAGRKVGLSLADRACLALAIDRKAKVVTADKDWKKTGIDVAMVMFR